MIYLSTLEKYQKLLEFAERRGSWKDSYPFNEKNFNMNYWIIPSRGYCGCLAGHMCLDSIYKGAGFQLEGNWVSYEGFTNFDALLAFFGGPQDYVGRIFCGQSYDEEAAFKMNPDFGTWMYDVPISLVIKHIREVIFELQDEVERVVETV